MPARVAHVALVDHRGLAPHHGVGIALQGMHRETRDALMQDLAGYREKVNAQLDQHEQLEFLVIVEDQWTTENDFVTPTMKVKRNVVEDHYLKHAEEWAAKRQPVVWAGTTG